MRPVLDVAKRFEREGSENARPRPVLGKYLNLTKVDGEFEGWKDMERAIFNTCDNLVEEELGFDEVLWINQPTEEKHREAQIAYTAVGISETSCPWSGSLVFTNANIGNSMEMRLARLSCTLGAQSSSECRGIVGSTTGE